MVLATTDRLKTMGSKTSPKSPSASQTVSRFTSSVLPDLFSQCCASGQVTRSDRYSLQATLLNPTPTEEELATIDRILHGIRRGWLTVEKS